LGEREDLVLLARLFFLFMFLPFLGLPLITTYSKRGFDRVLSVIALSRAVKFEATPKASRLFEFGP